MPSVLADVKVGRLQKSDCPTHVHGNAGRLQPMKKLSVNVTRRTLLKGAVASAVAGGLPGASAGRAQGGPPTMKRIPSTGETISCGGLGTWITFNVGDTPFLLGECAAIMAAFFEAGGRVIDSLPMYGPS
jgi:hypothetical protein